MACMIIYWESRSTTSTLYAYLLCVAISGCECESGLWCAGVWPDAKGFFRAGSQIWLVFSAGVGGGGGAVICKYRSILQG